MRDVERRRNERRLILAIRVRADAGRCSADVDRADDGNFRVLRGVGKVPDDEIGDIAVLLGGVRRDCCRDYSHGNVLSGKDLCDPGRSQTLPSSDRG